MIPHRTGSIISVFLIGLWSLLAPGARGCDVPVFQYALEYWPASPYELVVLHDGPLSAGEQKIVEWFEDASAGPTPRANLGLRLDNTVGGPKIVLHYPRECRIEEPAWSGGLTMESATALIDSPARRRIAQRLLGGDTAVWILLESGDDEKDAAARLVLEKQLALLEKTLELPIVPNTVEARSGTVVAATSFVRSRFSLVSLSRKDPAEAVLTGMLLSSEADLHRYMAEPMAFPVFGRGRVLYALVGKGLNDENITEACRFLTGPCSCQAKSLNPGTDLLMAVDWEAGLQGSAIQAVNPQPLVGLAGIAGATHSSSLVPKSTGVGDPEVQSNPPPRRIPTGRNILRNMLITLGLIALVAGGVVIVIVKR